MVEVRTINGSVLFSYDEKITTLKEEIVKHKDLRNADLRRADLSGVDLKEANLERTDLRGANFRGANLIDANFEMANLSGADFEGACISCANLKHADLMNANLSWTNLTGASLRYADLYCTDLSNANLFLVDLRWAKLSGANLSGAYLRSADLRKAKNVPNGLPMACPENGSFIAWKKVYDSFIIKLEIPSDAKRSSATTNKCRCSKAMVLEIVDIYADRKVDKVVNTVHAPCTYKVGEMVYPDSFNEDRWDECSNGIHFFMTEEEAVNYH